MGWLTLYRTWFGSGLDAHSLLAHLPHLRPPFLPYACRLFGFTYLLPPAVLRIPAAIDHLPLP